MKNETSLNRETPPIANVLLCAGRYEIQFAYGGRYKGETIHTVVIEGKCQKEALANFHKYYNSELIIYCKEL
jgi:hypothetical protein